MNMLISNDDDSYHLKLINFLTNLLFFLYFIVHYVFYNTILILLGYNYCLKLKNLLA